MVTMMKRALLLVSLIFTTLSTTCTVVIAQRDRLDGSNAYTAAMDRSVCRSSTESLLEIVVQTDSFPEDTSWILTHADSGRLVGLSYRFQEPNKETRQAACVQEGKQYYFAIMDGHGDGLCCGHGNGYYKLVLNNDKVLFEGGQFTQVKEHTFVINSSGNDSTLTPPNLAPVPSPVPPSNVRPRIAHPHCDPGSGKYNPPDDDAGNQCSGKLSQCARDRSLHKWEYDEASTMVDKCFRSCADRVGLDNFCRVIPPPTPSGEPRMPFCSTEGQHQWNTALVTKEDEFVALLNQQRSKGYDCPGGMGYFPPAPGVKRNPQLDCAARAQARKIVDYSISPGLSNSSPSLHQLCNPNKGNCDTFKERMEKAGYEDWWGYIGENANWNYRTAAETLEGWMTSPGHCPLLHKQDFTQIQTEIGVGYFEDSATGKSAWVMVAGQQ